jgi:hypothetical protein
VERSDLDLGQLLIDCLKRDTAGVEATRFSGLSPERWDFFLSLAHKHQIASLLWHRIREKGLDSALPLPLAESLRQSLYHNTLKNLCLYRELHRLLAALQSEGIPLILLKGIYLAEAVYENPGLREMSDIDVLARPSDLSRIVEILQNLGYVPLQPICIEVALQVHHHLPGMVKQGIASFEVHWNLIPPGESNGIDSERLWQDAIPVRTAKIDALALSPEDLILHLCHHSSYLHQFTMGLRPFCDITETIRRFDATLRWQTIIEQAIARKWHRGVYLILRLAQEMMGAEVPANVLEKLRPEDVSDAFLETVLVQILACKSVPVPFAQLMESGSRLTQLHILLQRIFLPKATMAMQYSVPVDSLKLYWCYWRRFFDVLRRHGKTLRKFHNKDTSTKDLAERVNTIAGWLNS